jgi:gamma-glutamylcysteine synthetase
MNLIAEKLELAKRLLDVEDEGLLFQLKQVLDNNGKDFWDDLPENVKQGITRAKKQAAEGKLTPHDEVMSKYAKYL